MRSTRDVPSFACDEESSIGHFLQNDLLRSIHVQNNNENREVAIQISGVKKMYKLGQIGGGTLQADLQSWWARVRGKEDPNSIIGQEQRLVGQTFMALNGIDLTVYKGEALGIIGANGAGKSTMLKLLCRVTAPTEGEIDIYGRIASMLEVGTGFNKEMTGRENVYMNGAILGMTKAEIDAKMEQIIEFSEVRDFIDTPVKRYSSGMYVKLAFSVAAHLDSEIMIMDEVLAVGDMAFQKKCLDKMREAATKEGRTVLYVSHNMNTIRQLCDRCIVLDKGRIIFDGNVDEAINIYMSAIKLSDCVVDLASMKRSNMFVNNDVFMDLLKVDSDCSVFKTGSIIRGSLTIHSERNYKNLRLEIPLRSTNGVSVSRFLSNPCIQLHKGKNELAFSIDISSIAPGRYTLNPIIRELNEYGGQGNLDGLVDAFCFEIIPASGFNNGVEWSTFYSGYYVPPTIIVHQ